MSLPINYTSLHCCDFGIRNSSHIFKLTICSKLASIHVSNPTFSLNSQCRGCSQLIESSKPLYAYMSLYCFVTTSIEKDAVWNTWLVNPKLLLSAMCQAHKDLVQRYLATRFFKGAPPMIWGSFLFLIFFDYGSI